MKHSGFYLRRLSLLLSAMLSLGLLAACYHSHRGLEIDGFDAPKWTESGIPNTELSILTRSTEADAGQVSYPIYIYLFRDGACLRREVVTDGDEELLLRLEAGNYAVYAVGGADDARYTLPTASDATSTSQLALRAEQKHGDLMTASPFASLDLMAGDRRSIKLSMHRMVMLLREIVLEKIPSHIAAATFEVTPLYAAVQLDGNYASSTSVTESFVLSPVGSGTWRATESGYLLPASAKAATLTVKLTDSEGTKSYSYVCEEQLEANHRISIHGTYTDTGVTLSGTVTGDEWDEDRTISFDFDENGTSGSDGDGELGSGMGGSETDGDDDENSASGVTEIAVGKIYKGCYILAVKEGGRIVTLLSSHQEVNFASMSYAWTPAIQMTDIDAALANWPEEIGSEWRVPNLEEAQNISDHYTQINEVYTSAAIQDLLINSKEYVFKSNESFFSFQVGSVGIEPTTALSQNFPKRYTLIAVTDISVLSE